MTARLREAIARLAKLHAELGAHLEAAVETGASCVYAPVGEMRWRT